MIHLLKLSIVTLICICTFSLTAQDNPYDEAYASNFNHMNSSEHVTEAKISSNNFAQRETLVSEAFLNANDGFIGIVFSEAINKPDVYYKIVDNAGKEIYSGSAHSHSGGNTSLYYNTQNLPAGQYRIFIENDDFFLSTSFVK